MAVLSKDELFAKVKGLVGDDSSDETLSILEDMQDTVNDYESKVGEDWKSKYEENDSAWRKKYQERFFSGEPIPKKEPVEDKKRAYTFEELFKTE